MCLLVRMYNGAPAVENQTEHITVVVRGWRKVGTVFQDERVLGRVSGDGCTTPSTCCPPLNSAGKNAGDCHTTCISPQEFWEVTLYGAITCGALPSPQIEKRLEGHTPHIKSDCL